VPEVQVEVIDVAETIDVVSAPLPPPPETQATLPPEVPATPEPPPVKKTANPMWKDSVGDMPTEFNREAEIANVKRLVSEGYFTQDDLKEALKLYGSDRISNLADDAFESFVLGHIRLVEQIIDETTKRNIPRAKLNEFARLDNEHSFFVSSIATKRKILSLIMEQPVPQQGN
jgi:hypothetical protein